MKIPIKELGAASHTGTVCFFSFPVLGQPMLIAARKRSYATAR
jgi:hypothetical protein